MRPALLPLDMLGAVESAGAVTFGLWLPWVSAADGNRVSVKIIHEHDQFLQDIAAGEFAMSHALRAPHGDFWSVTIPIAGTPPPTPRSAWGQPGRYVYRYQIDNPIVGTLDWIIDPFAREFGAGRMSAFTLGDQPYTWSADEKDWRAPALEDLVVYEVNIAELAGDLDRTPEFLTYLTDLGVNAIEVMPLSNVSTSVDWSYLPIGYFGVDERFGKPSDFQALVDAAHQHGVAVIVDVVYGHAGVDFGYYDAYTRLRYHQNPFMGSFAQNLFDNFGKSTDFQRPLTRDYFFTVNHHWLDVYHVDGFRYDCVPNYWDGAMGIGYASLVYETYQLTKSNLAGAQSHWHRFDAGPGEPLRLIQCAEQLQGPAEVLRDTYSNCTWQNETFDAAKAVAKGDRGRLTDWGLRLGLFGYPEQADTNGDLIAKTALQYLENHDHDRFICNFGGLRNPDEAGNPLFLEGDRSRWFMLQPYLIATLTAKGIPMLWQGEEFCENYFLPDFGAGRVALLRPLRWDFFYDENGRGVVTLVRKLLRLRRERPQLRTGQYFFFNHGERYQSRGVLLFARYDDTHYTLVAVNTTDTDQTVPFWFPIAGDYAEELHGGDLGLKAVGALQKRRYRSPRTTAASGPHSHPRRQTMPKTTERTSFTRDIHGRYLCNDINEVNAWKTQGGRPFDIIVIGGGTFGAAIAEHLWYRQRQNGGGLRTLVVDAGLFTVPEHVQNTGIQGFDDGFAPFTLNENASQPEPPKKEVWGVPWKAAIPFKGLAYTIGGRSLFWGGWSPRLLDAEMPATWPAPTVADLKARYFGESTRQIGVDETNDFIFGDLQNSLRRRIFDKIGAISGAIPLGSLPASPLLKPGADPATLLGLTSTSGLSQQDLQDLLKLEAPLAVQARAPHAGFFPLNKFSTVPLLMKAARTASRDFSGDDARKDFMVLPDTHVLSVRTAPTGTGTWRVTGIDTSQGFIELAPGGVAVVALGTIESARLALASFDGSGIPTLPLMGKNLMAHARSNLTFRVPRSAIPGLPNTTNEVQTAALFLKCRATQPNGDHLGYFHLQITATGGGDQVGAEQELYQKVPDIDFFDALKTSTDTHVAVAIRGIGEMEPADPANPDAHASRVDIDSRTDEYGIRRARVTLTPSANDSLLWTFMENTMTELGNLIANGAPVPAVQRDFPLGTTHHETGTLWMGTDPTLSVTDPDGRFHHTDNLYAAGPCLFPSIGSPNPMLTGIAMARRTGDRIITPPAFVADAGFEALFDGTGLGDWQMSTIRNQPGRDNPGRFLVRRGALEGHPGTDLGLLWLSRPTPPRYVLRLQWMMTAPNDNAGVFVAFPHPEQQNYDNTAWVGVNFGFEIQIDQQARPDGADIHRTGAIYSFKGATDGPLNVRPVGEWNDYEITVDGQDFTVALNGQVVNLFHFTGDPQSPRRGLPSTPQEPRFIGLQTHTGVVLFRHIQWKAL